MTVGPGRLICETRTCSRQREHGTPWRKVLALLVCGPALISLLVVAAGADETSRRQPRIELHTASTSDGARFDVLGLTDRQRSAFAKLPTSRQTAAFAVFVDADLEDPPPIVGRLSLEKNVLRFTPRYPLEPGLSYRAVLDRGLLSSEPGQPRDPVSAVFGIAKPDARPTTVVERIDPTSDHLPENHLKFYIHFSAPMSRGEAYRRVHLVDSDGKEVEAVFLELGEELWDGQGQRFTLYFEPGRVKRGLKPREELGPVLHEGRSYTLVIDKQWRDAARVPLKAGARKTFTVGPPDDTPIDPARWQLAAPSAGSTEPLVVRFGESLDGAQLQRVVWVTTRSGKTVPGSIRTTEAESQWQFTPQQPWSPGKFHLVAETTLEDLAGNSIRGPFEVDQFGPVQAQIETKTVSIPFAIAPAQKTAETE